MLAPSGLRAITVSAPARPSSSLAAGNWRWQRARNPRSLPNGTFPGRHLVNGRGGAEVPIPARQIGWMGLGGT